MAPDAGPLLAQGDLPEGLPTEAMSDYRAEWARRCIDPGGMQPVGSGFELEARGVRVRVELQLTRTLSGAQAFTQLDAAYVLGVGPDFDIRPVRSGEAGTLTHPLLDGTFFLSGDDLPALDALLLEPIAKPLLELPNIRVWAKDNIVQAWAPGGRTADGTLRKIADLLVDVARYRTDWVGAVASLPGARLREPEGVFGARSGPRVEVPPSPPVVFEAEARGSEALVAVARIELHRLRHEPFTVAWLWNGKWDGASPVWQPDASAWDRRREIGAATLQSAGGTLSLRWPGLVRQIEALRAGVRLLRGLASPMDQGPYR